MADEPQREPTPQPPAQEPPPAPAPQQVADAPTPPAPAPTPEPPAPAPSTEGAEAPKAEAPDWRELVAKVDPEELLKDRRIGGIVGARLAEERRRAAQEAEAQLQARQQDAELERLRRDDPQGYADEVGRRNEERARQGQLVSGIHSRIATWAATLPPEVQQKLSGKSYPGPYEDGVLAYTREVAELLTEHRVAGAVAKARKQWEKDERPAIRQEILAELNGGEPSPDTTRGGAPPNGFTVPTTWKEIDRLPKAVFKAHEKDITAAALSGRIK